MNPKLQALIQARQQTQGGQQPAPFQGANTSQFDQNPFEAIFAQGAGQGAEPQSGSAMPQMGGGLPPMGQADVEAQESQAMGQQPDPAEDDSQKGVNPGGTKFVLGAIQQLNNFITDATDRSDIATVRSVITLLTRLIQKDQERQSALQSQLAGRL